MFDQKRHDELFETARALAVTHNLLSNGIYQGSGYKDLSIAIPFIQTMHETVMKELEPLMDAKAQLDAASTGVVNE